MIGSQAAVIHESPFRIIELMETIAEALPKAMVSCSCDLTKLHELTLRGTPQQVLDALKANEKSEKGEYCVVLDLRQEEIPKTEEKSSASLEARLFEKMLDGLSVRDAVNALIAEGEKKNPVYAASLKVKEFLKNQ